jgi:RHS repeat-associated protein
MHEYLPEFELINMNGRVYDPYTALFLCPDPYIQAPDFTQNYNRYAYVLNNPLRYTDPSGYNYKPIDWDKGSGGALYYIPFDPGIFGNPFRPYSFTSVDEVESYRDWSYLHGIGATNTSFSDYLAGGGIYELNGFNVRTYYRPWFYNTYTVDNGVTYSYTYLGGYDKYSGGTYVGQGGINLGWNNGDGSMPEWINTADNVLSGIGVLPGLLEGNYGLTANQTFRYAQRINGRVVSAAELTAAHTAQSLKIANSLSRFNLVTGVLGTGYSVAKAFTDYNIGGWNNVNGLDLVDAGVGAGGLVLSGFVTLGMVSSPIGWGVAIFSGVYFSARLVYDLSIDKK